MGFDLSMVNPPAKLTPAQIKKAPAYYADYEKRLGELRFFASEMPALVAVLVVSGVVAEDKPPKFPAWPPGGMDEDSAQELGGQMLKGVEPKGARPEHVKAMKAYLAARQVVVSTRSATAKRVPLFKFQSNEGWVVTPEECKLIVAALTAKAPLITPPETIAALKREWTKESERMPARFRPQSFAANGPQAAEFRKSLQQFIEFNELAASFGGYSVN